METKKFLNLFGKKEISNCENLSYTYIRRKKIVTFVPLKFVDKLTFEMSFAGAGKIGNYDMCSFRMKGLGTYMPGNKAKPFAGKRGKISFEEEVRLELECKEENIDKVIDTLLLNHPYEEVAYEIYNFEKRSGIPSSVFITFNKNIAVKDIIAKINDKIEIDILDKNINVRNLIYTINGVSDTILKTANKKKCRLIVYSENKNIKFKYI